MEDGLFSILRELVQPAGFALLGMIGFGVRQIWRKVCESDRKIDDLRDEIHKELREYTRKETCCAHREDFQHQIDRIILHNGLSTTPRPFTLPHLPDQSRNGK